jgi:hypothetical protein
MTVKDKSRMIRIIHTAKNKCTLTDDTYRTLLQGAAGISSTTELSTWIQYRNIMIAFGKLGFHIHQVKKPFDTGYRNPEWISAAQEYYIRGLWDLASRKKDERSLRALCKRITGNDDISFCRRRDAQKLILALRSITIAAGFNPDGV